MTPEQQQGRSATDRPAATDDGRQSSAVLNMNAIAAFNAAAAHRSAAVRCIASAVRHTAYATRLTGASHAEVAQAVTAVRRELVHALAGAIGAEHGGEQTR